MRPLPVPVTPTRLSTLLLTLVLLAPAAWAQDEEPPTPPAETPPVVEEGGEGEASETTEAEAPVEATEPTKPAAIVFSDDLETALATAREESRPVLVVAVPDWYESPVWQAVESESLATDDGRTALAGFVPVLLRESPDREVHARHRVPFREHPLAVVLAADGSYLGFLSGLPVDGGAAAWAEAIAAIPPRAKRTTEVRDALAVTPDAPELLLELGTLLVAAGESARADDVFARLERVDPLGDPARLGEARYQRLRLRVVGLLEKQKPGDVEPQCLKWRRRFSEHARFPEVLLLQANARYLANDADGARELWSRVTKDHADTAAAKSAQACLDAYPAKK